jgi:hypothetical protein
MYIISPEGWPESLNSSKIIVRLRQSLNSSKYTPWLWYNNIIWFLLSLEITQSAPDPNLYLPSDGILTLLYVEIISISNQETANRVAIEVKV